MEYEVLNKEVENDDIGQEIIITLTDNIGQEIDCTVLTTFVAGGRDYIALLPHQVDENGNVNIQLYRYKEVIRGGEEGIDISNILSDMEFDEALKVFETLIE